MGQNVFNFAEPPTGYNFTSPPDFTRDIWNFPDRTPVNPFFDEFVNPFGATGFPEPMLDKFMTVNQTSPGGFIDSAIFQTVSEQPFRAFERELELLSETFGFAIDDIVELQEPFNKTPQEFQEYLNSVYTTDYIQVIREIYALINEGYQTGQGGGIIIDPANVQSIFDNLLNFLNNPNLETAGASLLNPFQLPFTTYSHTDMYRLAYFLSNRYNVLSKVYGLGETIDIFPALESFWSKLWSGIKKFFPGLIISRNAFLAATELNLFDLANKMAAYADESDENKESIRKSWEGFGGNWNTLKSSINSGQNVGITIGADVVAIIAAAAPIVIAILSLIDWGGDDEEKDETLSLIQNAITQGPGCVEYVNAMTSFVSDFNLSEVVSVDLINQEFAFAFPEIPDSCKALFDDIVSRFIEETEETSSGGSSGSGSGSSGPYVPGSEIPQIENDSSKILIPALLAALMFT